MNRKINAFFNATVSLINEVLRRIFKTLIQNTVLCSKSYYDLSAVLISPKKWKPNVVNTFSPQHPIPFFVFGKKEPFTKYVGKPMGRGLGSTKYSFLNIRF